MDNSGYVTLSRQSGLLKALDIVANNVANIATTGFRREGATFAESLAALPVEGGSLSMAVARVRETDFSQGGLSRTGGAWDLAIEGEGFFMVETPEGPRLTRAGAFARSAAGEIVTQDGLRLLDEGGAPVFAPPGADIAVAADGAVTADGRPVARIGVFVVADPGALTREGSQLFDFGEAEPLPAEGARVLQGFVEQSNVNPVSEIARLIQVQRAYELGQSFLETEHERMSQAVRTLGQSV